MNEANPKLSAVMKLRWANPEWRKRVSAVHKNHWADPDYRNRVRDGQRQARAHRTNLVTSDELRILRSDPSLQIIPGQNKEFVVCLECGQKLATLSSHLNWRHNLTFKKYATKWLGVRPVSDTHIRRRRENISDEELASLRLEPTRQPSPNFVVCLECGVKLQQIINPHLAIHGLTISRYLQRWPGAPLLCGTVREKKRIKAQANTSDPDVRRRISEKTRRQWKDPETRKRMCVGIAHALADPATKQKQSESLRRAFASKEIRNARSERLKRVWTFSRSGRTKDVFAEAYRLQQSQSPRPSYAKLAIKLMPEKCTDRQATANAGESLRQGVRRYLKKNIKELVTHAQTQKRS